VGVFYDFIFVEVAELVYDLATFHPIFFLEALLPYYFTTNENSLSSFAMSLYMHRLIP